jgi:beta-lactamase regulating signal transducer with metallopeptidase domain
MTASIAMFVESFLQPFLQWLGRSSWQAVLVVGIVLALRKVAGPILGPRWRHALWTLVLLRVALPVAPQSPFSAMRLAHLARDLYPARWSAHRNDFSPTPSAARPDPTGFTIRYSPLPLSSALPNPAPPTATSIDPRLILSLFSIWLLGFTILCSRLLLSNLAFARRCSRSSATLDAQLLQLLDNCARAMRLARAPALCVTDAVTSPAVAGMFHPRLLLPPALGHELSLPQLRLVFLHELAHVKCRDIALEWLWTIAHLLYWFNPVLWLARPLRRADRELARDAMVLAVTGSAEAEGYGQMLLSLVQSSGARGAPRVLAPGLVGIADGRCEIRRRIAMIARFDVSRRWMSWVGLALFALAGCAALTDPRDANAAKAQAGAPTTQRSDTAAAREAEAREEAGGPVAASGAAPRSVADAKAQAALDRNMPEINFQAVPLGDAVDFLRDVTGANIFVNWKALEAAGVERNVTVTARVRDVKFSKALKMMLDDVSAGNVRVGYEVDEGVIMISTEEDLARNVVTRVYDVRDLLISGDDAPPADFAGVEHPKPGATSQPATQPLSPRDDAVKRLTELILNTVAPDTWKPNGGNVGNFTELHGQLIVTQTPSAQSALERLLGQLRENRGLQVIVESRFLNVNPQELKDLSPKLRERLVAASGGAGVSDAPQQFLSTDEVQELLRAAQDSRDSSTLFAPRLTLFNGQRAYVMLASSLPYVASVAMTKAADGKVGYDPQVKQLQVGLLFDVQATLTADRRAATVMLQPTISRLDRIVTEPAPGTPPEAQVFVQHPVLTMRQLRTITNVPDGQTLLVGGFQDSTVGGNANEAPATQPVGERAVHELMNSAGGRRLFLLVRTTIIAPREQPREQQPTPATR